MPTEATGAHVLVSKYADLLPLHRQGQMFSRQGVDLDRSTLADWVGRAAFELRLVYDALMADLKRTTKLFMDETRAPALDPGARKTKTGYFWAIARVAIDCTPEPVLLPADRDHNFVQVPLVGGLRTITPDLCSNLCSKFRHPISDRLMADRNAAFCQQILNVPQAEGETVVGPDGIANNRAWKAIAFQGLGGDRQYHHPALASQIGTGNLTMPAEILIDRTDGLERQHDQIKVECPSGGTRFR